MGHEDFGRQWSKHAEQRWGQHRSGWAGQWGSGWGGPVGRAGRRGRQGPPPWVAGLFGLAQTEPQRGPKVRRGDVRAAILDMSGRADERLPADPQIEERSGGAWKPSPGSVYPTISQLEDEGLVEADEERGRRTLRLSDGGGADVEEHPDELAAVWRPFVSARRAPMSEFASLKPELGQVAAAVWQIITTGTDQQRRDAIGVLIGDPASALRLAGRG